MKKKIDFCLMLAWMFVIFSFSQQNGTASHDLSVSLLDWLHLDENMLFYLRKMAHFTEYAILGILAWRYTRNWKWALLIAVLFAASDECHQIFISGRSASPFDVGIDSLGALLGVGLCHTYAKHRQ